MTNLSYVFSKCLAMVAIVGLIGCSDDATPQPMDSGTDATVADIGGDTAAGDGPVALDGALPADGGADGALADSAPVDAVSTPDQGVDTTCADSDGDTVCDAQDVCPGLDDRVDLDANSVPDCKENLLTNGQFASDAAGWLAESSSGLAHDTDDALSSASSGSAKLTHATVTTVPTVVGSSQCVQVQSGQVYVLYAQLRVVDANSKGYSGGVNVKWYASKDCKGATAGVDNSVLWFGASWTTKQHEVTAKGASARVRLNVSKPAASGVAVVHYDNALFKAK